MNTTVSQNDNPDEPRPAGETERDNDALRPTDPKQRQGSKGTPSGESTAQETAKPHTRGPQTQVKP
ncbi:MULTISPECIES: hypothetical protein [Pseudomonas]|jgi:hypothetical protein|uniref:hypothetical protein n=1 Tax=Pseudomonas TaxID=286 RepID=UPI000AC5E0E4|nr:MULTISPECIES: hypothetical protein [unclassified Pseudomonas]MCR8931841.1 hypothetical protein [Pseudomonas sp. S11A4]MCR8975449.1 hypothetical protein [Pseudomonas sp. S11P7]